MMRPELTPQQAARITQDAVLRLTGTAGAERVDPWSPPDLSAKAQTPDYLVGQDAPTVQAAVNRALCERGQGRVVIGIPPGRHSGLVYLPRTRLQLCLVGLGDSPADTVLDEVIDAEMSGAEYTARFGSWAEAVPPPVRAMFDAIAARDKITTANASVLRVEADDCQILNLTIHNLYNADRPGVGGTQRNAQGQFTTGQHQAVALLSAGADRLHLQDLHLRSFQDTLYLQSPRKGETVRSYVRGCDIEGDVDFIFGQSTAWFEGCTIRSLGSRCEMTWATAPSTDIRTPFGFVFHDCDFTHDDSPNALAGRFSLGRQWFESVRATPYGVPDIAGYGVTLGAQSAFDPPNGTISPETLRSVGKCLILNSRIGAHIDKTRPWDHWSGRDWNPRHRPAQYRAADLFAQLAEWLPSQDIDLSDIPPEMVFLAEFGNSDG